MGTGLWGFMDESGAWAVSPAFDEARSFSAGLAACRQPKSRAEAERVRYGQLWGYVDSSGAWAVGPGFDEAGDFSEEGLAPARDAASGLCGLVDETGSWVVPASFSDLSF